MRSCILSKGSRKVCPVVGLVITASHNEEQDNGIKFVDPNGAMMDSRWEEIVTRVANAKEEQVCNVLFDIGRAEDIDWSLTPRVYIGHDTRPSSLHLVSLVKQGLTTLRAATTDFGFVSTPQVHWLVGEMNYGRLATLNSYYSQLSSAFLSLLSEMKEPLSPLTIDCANGVGKYPAQKFATLVKEKLHITLINTEEKGVNFQVGAEHVQKTKTVPKNVNVKENKNKKFASVDGDADRLVYFYINSKDGLELLDGDKIGVLAASFLKDLLSAAQLELKMGVIQTAYANGASTHYLVNVLEIPVHFANTGVKYMHPKAKEYDVGIYFEANGHGTVLFSTKAINAFQVASNSENAFMKKAAKTLLILTSLINPYIGDALSDMLFVEVALTWKKWTLQDWATLYRDFPSTILKVEVKDKNVLKTTDAEQRCVTPRGLQERINKLVASKLSKARRSFVRPSGTENVVRVYAEADTQEEADELAAHVKRVVLELAGGFEL